MNAHDTTCFFAGMGIGAGLMYALDPQMGRRRRSLMRDQATHLMREAQEGFQTVAADMCNRTRGLTAEARSAWQGSGHGFPRKRLDLLNDRWSPATRALVGLFGLGLVAYGLTQRFPWACVTGTAGLAIAAAGATNTGVRDLVPEGMHVPESFGHAADSARQVVAQAREMVGV